MEAVHEEIGCFLGGRMSGSVEGKLHERKLSGPIVTRLWQHFRESANYQLIANLTTTLTHWVITGRGCLLDSQITTESVHDVVGKLSAII